MKFHIRRPVPHLVAALLSVLLIGSCGRSEKKEALPVAQDTMLLHDLALANRNTAAVDMDTTIPIVVRSRPADEESDEVIAAGGGSGSPRAILTPSGSGPRIAPPRRARDAPAPTNLPPPEIAPASDDPCNSPGAENQRTCLNRSIARSDASLNRVYQQLVTQARLSGGPQLEERFHERQRAWIITRDEECRAQTRSQEGELWARVRARCLADYSGRRTRELQESLNKLRGR